MKLKTLTIAAVLGLLGGVVSCSKEDQKNINDIFESNEAQMVETNEKQESYEIKTESKTEKSDDDKKSLFQLAGQEDDRSNKKTIEKNLGYLCPVKVLESEILNDQKTKDQKKSKTSSKREKEKLKKDDQKNYQFKTSKAPHKHRKNEVTGKEMTLYFTTDKDTLYPNDKFDLRTYVKKLPAKTHLILEGYADYRGPTEHNQELGKRRAERIAEYIRTINPEIETEIVSYGEGKPVVKGKNFKALQANRRVKIIPQKTVITQGLDTLVSDYYLIDQTGSMNNAQWNGVSKWDEVKKYKFPKGSQVFTFNSYTNMQCEEGKDLEKLTPDGETPLFIAIYDLLNQMEKGKKATILTDGMNNVGNVSDEAIIRLAKEKEISISFVALYPYDQSRLEHISQETQGRTYFSDKR